MKQPPCKGGLALDSIKWSDIDPHSKNSRKEEIAHIEGLMNEADIDCNSIVDKSFGIYSSYPGISQY